MTTATHPATLADPAPRRRIRLGTGISLLIIGGSFLACFIGLGRAVEYGFPAACLIVAGWLLSRRCWGDYVEFALWVWLLEPEVRRMVDYHIGYHSVSPVMIAGPLVGFCALPWAIVHGRRSFRDVRWLFAIATAVYGYAFCNGVLRQSSASAIADLLNFGGPLITGLLVATLPERDEPLHEVFLRVGTWAALLLGVYGVVQFLALPAWDAFWIVKAGIQTVGRPVALQVRVFSTLDDAGPFAVTMVVLMLLTGAARRQPRWLRAAALSFGLLALGLSLDRTGWIAGGLALALLVCSGRLKLSRSAIGAVVLLVALAAFGGPIRDAISSRVANTVSAGSSDTSLSARISFQEKIAPQAFRDWAGAGFGSAGVATKLSGNSSVGNVKAATNTASISQVKNFDSGVFELIFSLGSVCGLVFLLATLRTVIRAWRRSLRLSLVHSYAAAGAIALTFGLLFTDTYKSVYGVFFWCLLALCGRVPTSAGPAERSPAESRLPVAA